MNKSHERHDGEPFTTEIIVDDATARAIQAAANPIHLRDAHGRYLGRLICNVTAEDIAEARRRIASDQPRFTTDEVHAYLDELANR